MRLVTVHTGLPLTVEDPASNDDGSIGVEDGSVFIDDFVASLVVGLVVSFIVGLVDFIIVDKEGSFISCLVVSSNVILLVSCMVCSVVSLIFVFVVFSIVGS